MIILVNVQSFMTYGDALPHDRLVIECLYMPNYYDKDSDIHFVIPSRVSSRGETCDPYVMSLR